MMMSRVEDGIRDRNFHNVLHSQLFGPKDVSHIQIGPKPPKLSQVTLDQQEMDGWTLHGCLVLGWSGLDKKGNNNWVDTDEVTQTRVVDNGKKEKSGENQPAGPHGSPPPSS